MTDVEFWHRIKADGQVTWDVYPALVLALFLLAAAGFGLTTVAARRSGNARKRFLSLLLASAPLVLIGPALYPALKLRAALHLLGESLPADSIDFSTAQAARIGASLNTLGLWAAAGAALTLPILWNGLLAANPPLIGAVAREISRRVTAIATRAFGSRGGSGGRLHAPHGTLTIQRGQRAGSIEAIRPDFTIGGKGDIQINDPIVSRSHARLLVSGQAVALLDLGSLNGTYIVRGGQSFMLSGQPIGLSDNDLIYLGDPDQPEAVEILFQQGA